MRLWSKIQFSKKPKICRNTSFDEWNKEKNIFLAHFEIVQNFHHFCKVRGCRFSVKNSIFQKLPKVCRNTSFDEWNKEFCQKKFLAHFEIVQNFHHFCKVRGCGFSVKNSIFQKLPKSL